LLDASVALAARIVLAAVLLVSAVAKVRTRDATREQMIAVVGEDARLAALVSLLPVVEIVVAVALVAAWSPIPGLVALVLLAFFTGILLRARARHVPCACFGAGAADTPVGSASIVRNGVLAALAVLATGDPSGSSAAATVGFTVVFGAVAAVTVRASRSPVNGA
jgi:hypothetical protein